MKTLFAEINAYSSGNGSDGTSLQFACFLQDRRAVGEQMFLRSCRRLGHIQRFQRWNSCPWIRYINSMWMCPRC